MFLKLFVNKIFYSEKKFLLSLELLDLNHTWIKPERGKINKNLVKKIALVLKFTFEYFLVQHFKLFCNFNSSQK